MTDTTTQARPDLELRRTFDAPRAMVFEAFANEEQALQWFGPRAFPATSFSHDFRSGGTFEYEMTGPEGVKAPGNGIYEQVVPGERIVVVSQIDKPDGDGLWFQVRQVYTFTDAPGGGTDFQLQCFVIVNEDFPGLAGMEQGWNETLDRLGEFLAA